MLCRATQDGWVMVTFLTKRGPLEKGMANHFSILALSTPWTVWKIIDKAIPKESTWTSSGKASVIKDFTTMARHALCLHDQEMLWGGNPGTKACMTSKEDSASCFRCKVRLLICWSLVSWGRLDSSWDLFPNRELLRLLTSVSQESQQWRLHQKLQMASPGLESSRYRVSHDSQPTSLTLKSGMHPDLGDSVTVAALGGYWPRGWGPWGVGHTATPSRAWASTLVANVANFFSSLLLLWKAIRLAALVGMGKPWLPAPCQHPWPSTDIAWALGLCCCCHQPLSPSCHCVHLCRPRHSCPLTVPKYLCSSELSPPSSRGSYRSSSPWF